MLRLLGNEDFTIELLFSKKDNENISEYHLKALPFDTGLKFTNSLDELLNTTMLVKDKALTNVKSNNFEIILLHNVEDYGVEQYKISNLKNNTNIIFDGEISCLIELLSLAINHNLY